MAEKKLTGEEPNEIPQRYIDFCKAVGRLAREYKLGDLSAIFNPGFDSPWRERIEMNWRSGRHYAETNKLVVTSTRVVHTTVDDREQANG